MVFQPIAPQCLFKQARLGIGSIQNRRSWSLAAIVGFAEVARNPVRREQCLVLTVRRLVVSDFRSALARGPQILALAPHVVGDHRRGRLQNVLRRAIVLLQPDDLGLGEVLLKLKNVADVGATPGVDRLILVSHGANIVVLARQHAHEFVLGAVGVLVLVDQQVLEAPVVVFANLRRGFQQAHSFEQKVVEIERVRLAQFLAILLVQVGDALCLGIRRLQIKLLRIKHVILRP